MITDLSDKEVLLALEEYLYTYEFVDDLGLFIKELMNRFENTLYEDRKSCGDIAMEVGVAVGKIGCPHCGTVQHGALKSVNCGWCDKNMFNDL